MQKFKIGEKVLVFDGMDWLPKGDKGDNSCFWKPAILKKVRKNVKESYGFYKVLYDILFLYNNRLSKGHLGIRKI